MPGRFGAFSRVLTDRPLKRTPSLVKQASPQAISLASLTFFNLAPQTPLQGEMTNV